MKNVLIVLIFIVLTGSTVNAQGITFGVKAGGNLAKFTNNDEFEFKFGPHFGAVADIEISEVFSLQPELLFSAQGYNQDFNGQRVKAKVDYFNIPIMASYMIAEGLRLQAGPQVGINLRKDIEVDDVEQSSIFVNDVDVSAIFGFQYMIDKSFFTQLRGAVGLTEIVTNLDQKHFVISLSFGFLFDRN